MGRYRANIDMDRLPQMLKAGYGQGTGSQYRPWIEVIHLPSRGLVCRVRGLTTGRVHHLLSQLETTYWYALDFAPSVVDIREQFPLLPIEDTLRIAERLGYRHPRHPQTRRPIVMTTDFLVTVRRYGQEHDEARAVKPSSELSNGRVCEKLAIERWYWQERGYCQLAQKRNLWHTDGMKTNTSAPNYKGFRFPPEMISHAVWLYFRFSLSFRDVEELLAQRGIVVSYETVRQWCLKFGQTYANELRRRRPRCGDKWHLDEVVLTIRGKKHFLWRAVDQDGNVLDILVQSRRNKKAARRFFRKLLKGLQYVPRVIITDKLKSYGAAKREILPGVEHRQHKRLNNRAENSHQPTRLREKKMRKFKSAKQAQRFLSAFGPIAGHFQPRRHLMNAQDYRAILQTRFQTWNEVTGVKSVA